MPVLVTGAARSGTSLTTSILQACGANLGPVNALFEHTHVRDKIIKPLLIRAGGDPLGTTTLPNRDADVSADNLRAEVEAVMPDEPWAFKCVKMCLIWRPWHRAFPDAKWVIVRRGILPNAESCVRTSFMSGRTTLDDWMNWSLAHTHRFEDMKAAGLDIIEVWPDDYIAGDTGQLEAMAEHCGLEWNPAALGLIDRGKWHHN